MPHIFDNISLPLLPTLRDALGVSYRGDFCVGYFNLRGWRLVDDLVAQWPGGDGACARVLIGMQRLPQDELRRALSLSRDDGLLDNATAIRLKRQMAEELREQLVIGAPTNQDEDGLKRLATQLRARQLMVKLFLKHTLHAKLYLLYRHDPLNPKIGYLGSSNLTLPGLSKQGELNVDVLDHDACNKLERWFNDRWADNWCLDVSEDLADIIENSWAREQTIPPYHIYLNMAYHLSQEAREGLSEFQTPREFSGKLFGFQIAAVKIASQYLAKRDGVLIGDVVGLGKTIMAAAVAKIFQEDHGAETLIICPKNLASMWQEYVDEYRLLAKVISVTNVQNELPDMRRYRLVIIDESHNLRNREGQRFKTIQDYITRNDSRCILLSATPYNKSYLDLSAQLRLFLNEDEDIGIRPERLIGQLGEPEFIRRHQCPVRSLAAFEKSPFADDWRDLMRLFMVRRTRSFIEANYCQRDEAGRSYLTLGDGDRSYFPKREPRTAAFAFDPRSQADQYARLTSHAVVDAVDGLALPRYGLGKYVVQHRNQATGAEERALAGLSRAGNRLRGFCRINLFKRLESDGSAFMQSVERHILRNFVTLHAIERGLDVPIGTQDPELLDPSVNDADSSEPLPGFDEDGAAPATEQAFRDRAAALYTRYTRRFRGHFSWVRPRFFAPALANDLLEDARTLLQVVEHAGAWRPETDAKLAALAQLLTVTHPHEKVLIFTQFGDTVEYLTAQLRARGIASLEGVTGESRDPTSAAIRFSPQSNGKSVRAQDELRILVATDVLSDGQNLQDCHIIVNFDLPWAIIRLVQRAGRVDRIGQRSDTILCYSFLPAQGVEQIINLRGRVRQRLRQNAEIIGTDEQFFEDDDRRVVLDIYNEKAGILNDDDDSEVDLASHAYQIWKNAIDADPTLQKKIADLPEVVYSAKHHPSLPDEPAGVLVYTRTGQGNDALAWIDEAGQAASQSQLRILRAAACTSDTPAVQRAAMHHELVARGVQHLLDEERTVGGQLGRPSGARFRTYERLSEYARSVQGQLFDTPRLHRAIEDIYRFPLLQGATDTLNRRLKTDVTNQQLAELVIELREAGRLCRVENEVTAPEPRIICSLGLVGA